MVPFKARLLESFWYQDVTIILKGLPRVQSLNQLPTYNALASTKSFSLERLTDKIKNTLRFTLQDCKYRNAQSNKKYIASNVEIKSQ